MNPISAGPVNDAPLLLIQSAPSTFERVVDVMADVATIVIALALIVAGLVAIYGALKVRGMIRRMRADFDPAIRSANAVADNARALSDRVRGSVEELSATVAETNQKVRRATEAAEVRLGELNALAGVMQREVEDGFVRAASAVRGVQVGTAALRRLARSEDADGGAEDEGFPGADGLSARGRTGRDIFD
jgi:hypothetical protein